MRAPHPVAEPHQPEGVVLVLGLGEELGDVFDAPDLGKHAEHSLVGAAVRGPPQRGDAGGNAGKRVGLRGRGDADGRGRRVLLVVGVQDEEGWASTVRAESGAAVRMDWDEARDVTLFVDCSVPCDQATGAA